MSPPSLSLSINNMHTLISVKKYPACVMNVYLRQLQGSHDSSEAEHVAHGALELGSDLDDFVQQTGPLLGRPSAAQHVHGQHGGHGLEPAGRVADCKIFLSTKATLKRLKPH